MIGFNSVKGVNKSDFYEKDTSAIIITVKVLTVTANRAFIWNFVTIVGVGT